MATFFESGTWVWIPDEDEVVLPAKAKSAFRLGDKATVVMENGSVSYLFSCLVVPSRCPDRASRPRAGSY